MENSKKKKLPKAAKAVGIILLVLIIIWGGFTIVSHAVYTVLIWLQLLKSFFVFPA